MKRIKSSVLILQMFVIICINPLMGFIPEIKASTPIKIEPICDFEKSVEAVNNSRDHWSGIETDEYGNPVDYGPNNYPGRAIDFGITGVTESNPPSTVGQPGGNYDLMCKNSNVYAAFSGTVYRWGDGCNSEMVALINTEKDLQMWYLHLNIDVANGTQVNAGDKIGTAAANGCTKGYVHNHILLKKNSDGSNLTYSSQYVTNLENEWEFMDKNKLNVISPQNNEQISFSKSSLTLSWEALSNYNGLYYLIINGDTSNPKAILPNNQTTYNSETNTYTLNWDTTIYKPNEEVRWYILSTKSNSNGGTIQSEERKFKINYNTPMEFVTYNDKLYQLSVDINDNKIQRRSYNTQSGSWGAWDKSSGGRTRTEIESIEFNNGSENLLVSAMVGLDSNIYHSYLNGTTNSAWIIEKGGRTEKDLKMVELNNKLYLFYVGLDNHIYVKSSVDGKTWTSPAFYGGRTSIGIDVENFDNKLFISFVGLDNYIYNKTFDGSTWTNAHFSGGRTYNEVELYKYNNKLYMSMVGLDDYVYTRYLPTTSNYQTGWTSFEFSGGRTKNRVELVQHNSKLYQTIIGLDNTLYNRNFNGSTWSNFDSIPTTSKQPVEMVSFNNKLFQQKNGEDGVVYVRTLISDGNWSAWVN